MNCRNEGIIFPVGNKTVAGINNHKNISNSEQYVHFVISIASAVVNFPLERLGKLQNEVENVNNVMKNDETYKQSDI